jgi:hypothetical protein
MLQRTVTYASLLRLVGACFLLYRLYLVVGAVTAQSWGSQNPGPAIDPRLESAGGAPEMRGECG